MDKETIQANIDKNRERINRILHLDFDPVTMRFLITKISDKNKELIKQLNDNE